MRKIKWLFFGYLTLVVLIIAGIAASFAVSPKRDEYTLYVAYASNVKTLDPASIADTTSSGVGGQIFENLYNYDYKARPYKLTCELAAELPNVSADGKTVTIKLRKGIHFVDPDGVIPGWEPHEYPEFKMHVRKGPQIKAQDFIFAWKRMADFRLASQNYSAILEGRIDGMDEWRQYTQKTPADQIDWDRPISGLEAPDDHTIVIRLKEPYPQLRYNLAHLPTAPVARDAVKYWGPKFKHHPIGSGPYILKEHLPEQRILFVANPLYRGKSEMDGGAEISAAERLPKVRRIQMDYFDEDLPAWALFQQGLLDIAGIPKDTFAQAIDTHTRGLTPEMQAKGITLRKEPYPAIWFYGFNMMDPVVGKNKPLRQAMSMAFDREKYIELFANGRGQPAIGPIPPGFPTYDPKLVNPYTKFDLSAAREKMKQAEALHGGSIPQITFLLPGTDTTFRQMGEFTKRQMDQIGVNIRVDYVTWARFQEMVDNKQAQFYALGWVADYPDEQTFLQLFWSKNESPGPNSANYKNPEYDKLYEKAVAMEPSPERDKLYRQLQAIVMEDTPWLLNFYSVTYTLSYDWVKNFDTNEYSHGNRKYIELDVELRRKRLSGG